MWDEQLKRRMAFHQQYENDHAQFGTTAQKIQ